MNKASKLLIIVIAYLVTALAMPGCGTKGNTSDGPPSSNADTETSPIVTFKLPDTGQIQSYTEEFGEDSDYLINQPSYVDNGDGTQTDNNTGLMWYASPDYGTWNEALNYCASLTFADHSDWRLPSAKELIYTADYDLTASSCYWTSTPNDFNPDYAWVVSMPKGAAFTRVITESYDIRCVRGHEYTEQRFLDNGDETVTDINTGLMWQMKDCHFSATVFESALRYCEDLIYAGYDDWRLPNIKELVSIVDHESHWPAIDTTYFPFTHHQTYWSSTSDATYPYAASTWFVDFDVGSVKTRLVSDPNDKYIRCVRTIP